MSDLNINKIVVDQSHARYIEAASVHISNQIVVGSVTTTANYSSEVLDKTEYIHESHYYKVIEFRVDSQYVYIIQKDAATVRIDSPKRLSAPYDIAEAMTPGKLAARQFDTDLGEILK